MFLDSVTPRWSGLRLLILQHYHTNEDNFMSEDVNVCQNDGVKLITGCGVL